MQTKRAAIAPEGSATAAAPLSERSIVPAATKTLLESVLDALPVGVLIFQPGPDGIPICLSANATFETWARYGRHQLIGLSLPRIRFLSENPRIGVAVEALLSDPNASVREMDWSIAESPRQRHFSAHISLLPAVGDTAQRVVVAVRDRTPEIQAERNLRLTMLNDALTGLPNRVLFTEQVEEALELGEDAHIAILIVNVDRFKRVNDSLGHVVGDELLVAVACRLLPCVRANDCIARLSGDEFAILIKNIEAVEDTRQIVDRIHLALKSPLQISGGDYFVSASIGIATTFASRRYAEDLIRDADFALHTAKSRGRGGCEIYQSSAHSAARDLFRMETDLRKSIERGELELYFQPFVNLADHRLAGFEALARWNHPERGVISPVDFIPVAEDSGLIVPLGRWALAAACQQLAEWRGRFGMAARHLCMGVNVSGIQLARDDVVEAVQMALDEAKLPGNTLKVELTESSIVENPERSKEIFAELKALKASIAMDDFGTGYSSLSYLQTLPIDTLKIDRSFVMAMLKSEDSYKIVKAIMSLASNLGMKTVAEGVEQIEQAVRLHSLGCTVAQGFYFSEPMSAKDATRLLEGGDVKGRIKPN
jgi:Amt family ammonium transporter